MREGELAVPVIDAATAEQILTEAGAACTAIAAVIADGADTGLVESAVAAARATTAPPTTQAEDDRARSAAERFLFAFLESLPETAGRFELNASLDFNSAPDRPRLICSAARRGSPLNSTDISTFSRPTAIAAIGQKTGSCNAGAFSCYDSWPKM